MQISHVLMAGALLLPLGAIAQEKRATPNPADPAEPAAASAPVRYESAFADYRPFTSPEQSPDKTWREANRRVGELGGHMGHLQPAPQEAPKSAAPKPASGGAHHHH